MALAMAQSKLATLVSEWAASREGVEPTWAGDAAQFVFDGAYEVEITQTTRGIQLSGSLGPLPANTRQSEALLSKLMKLQLGSFATDPEMLCLNDNDNLRLYRTNPIPITAADFSATLEAFVNAFAFWSDQMAMESAPPATAARSVMMFP